MQRISMETMIAKLGKEFAEVAGTLKGVERTENGDFIVPVDVMQNLLAVLQELFGTVRESHNSVKTVLENEHIPKEQAWNVLLSEADNGTEH